MGAKLTKGTGSAILKKGTLLLTVIAATSAYEKARAAGLDYEAALNEASIEVINVTPWSVREIVEIHDRAGDWNLILEASESAYRSGGNLLNGFQPGNVDGSRSQMLREYLFEGCDGENR